MKAYAHAHALNEALLRTRHVWCYITRENMAFTVKHGAKEYEQVFSLYVYVQYLAEAGLAHRTINNYVSALNANFMRLGLEETKFEDMTF